MASYDVAGNICHALGVGLARLALQRVQELFRDAQWAGAYTRSLFSST
jgi:hypothetical protein